ncbi:MAG TPA: UDP-N-acetylglucosamine--N-acetylmuramyl-(pentapeptide) pyrophosphoryl-undecaprenol N-acetylglucosamine transferase [Aquifex sp.]|nr:UDP-N-acetylglucosamine--N-acetylmuramyl-(pentapeptide) pyrophosphoryl-undecaprenol N-acetylglucosamine transferase [Aquifex sp.]
MGKPLLALAGGGTGGHFYPMLAFAGYAKKTNTFGGLVFVGDKNRIEGKKEHLLKEIFDRYKLLKMERFKGKNLLGITLSFLQTLGAAAKISPLLRGKDFVSLTFGGYTSAPLGLYTRLAGKPLFIHEQNAIPGMGNRYLSKFAKKVFITFPGSEKFFPRKKVVLTGIPLREELKFYKSLSREEVLKDLGWEDRFNILILGGSLGARSINHLAVYLASKLPEGVRLIHITGERNFREVEKLYSETPPRCEVKTLPFAEEMGKLLRISDFAVSRAGASTSAELAFFGIPTVFIPYPYAAYDHQYYNALYYAEGGGAYLFREEDLNPQKVLEIVQNHHMDRKLNSQKGKLMEARFIPDAEEKILKHLLEVINRKEPL